MGPQIEHFRGTRALTPHTPLIRKIYNKNNYINMGVIWEGVGA